MTGTRWISATSVSVTLVLATACGTVQVPTAARQSVSPATVTPPTGAPCSQTTSARTFSASPASNRSLALVNLNGSDVFVVRDITDINRPFTVSSPGSLVDYASKFVNAGELSSSADATMGLVRMPLSGTPLSVVSACGAKPFAWSPDGTQAAYIRGTDDPKVEALHIISGGQDRVVDTMPAAAYGVGCEALACLDSWDVRLLYSPDGAYISFVEQLAVAVFRIWTASGTPVKSMDGTDATMSAWSGKTFYWRDAKGVESWDNGVQSPVLPGVSWVRPLASPAGGQIVYMTRDARTALGHADLLDVATRKSREIASSVAEPAFLTGRYLWYLGQRPCAATDPCPVMPMIATLGYIYDVETGVQYPSIITTVWDVWPHPA